MLRASRLSLFLIVPIVFAFLAAQAGATPVLPTDRTSWEAVTSGIFKADFESLATPSVPVDFSSAGGYTTGGLQFIGLTPPSSYSLWEQYPSASQNYNWGTGHVLMEPAVESEGGYIPEVDALILAGTGLLGLLVARRLRRWSA